MTYLFSINDFFAAAELKVGEEGWKAYKWESVEGGSIVTGSIPTGVYRSGPRKGEPRFNGPKRRVIVTSEEMVTRAAAHEADTGQCWDCKGSGQTWAGWSKEDGTRCRTCKRCSGSGEAPK